MVLMSRASASGSGAGAAAAVVSWTGQRHDKRGLQQRDPDGVRVVPIQPHRRGSSEHTSTSSAPPKTAARSATPPRTLASTRARRVQARWQFR